MTKLSDISLDSGFIKAQTLQDDTLWQVSFERIASKNALNLAMYQDLANILAGFVEQPEARVLVVTGSEGCFTSGNDLADFASAGADGALSSESPLWQFMLALRDCPKPVVMAVEGVAVGIGSTMLLHADAVFAAPSASFAMPFAKLGLCPEYASSFIIPRLAGYLQAAQWLMLGETFSAEEALRGRLINAVAQEPLTAALEHAAKLAAMPPQALINTKQLLKASDKQAIDTCMTQEAQVFAKALSGKEFAAAIAAFFTRK